MRNLLASSIEQLGSGSPGIDSMWGELKQIFPHTDYGSQGLAFIILMITNIILRLLAGGAVLMIVYAGIRMITGGEEGLGEAKKAVTYALVGLVGALIADAVVNYVIRLVTLAVG
jgi:hypothetical protein